MFKVHLVLVRNVPKIDEGKQIENDLMNLAL